MTYSNRVYENIIEITWVFDKLEEGGKIKPWNILVEELITGSDEIKETIIQIAEDFEKEYPEDYDWNATDTEYLTEIQKYAEKRLVNEYGKDKEELHCGDIVKMLRFVDEKDMPLIGVIRDIDWSIDGEPRYGVKPLFADCIYYFLRDQLETGKLEWVKDERKII